MNPEYPFTPPPKWSDVIPHDLQKEIGNVVEAQLNKLPLELQLKWKSPRHIGQRFFIEASKYINIPGSEFWQDK